MNDIILKYLSKKGYRTVSTDYYTFIEMWENWWKNNVDFHKYHDSTGKERKMFSLGMAKRVSEDWASILFTERDEIVTQANTSQQTKVNNDYLNKQLKKLKVYKDLPTAIEKAMAMGTAGATMRVKNAKVDKNGKVSATNRTKLDIIYLDATQIVPLKVEHGKIIDVAFVSESIEDGKKIYYVELHQLQYDEELKKDIYVISNNYINEQGEEVAKKDIVKQYTFKSDVPLFSILKPAVANPLDTEYHNGTSGV